MSQKIISARVSCYGIKGRDRKAKFHTDELKDYPADALDRVEAERLAREWLSDIKQPTKASLSFYRGEIDGVFRSIMLNLRDQDRVML